MSSTLPKISAATIADLGSADYRKALFVGTDSVSISPEMAQSISLISSGMGAVDGPLSLAEKMKANPVNVNLPKSSELARTDDPVLPASVRMAAKSKGSNEPQLK